METNQLKHIFNTSFHFENWKDVVKSYFKNTDFYRTPIESIDKSLKYHQVAQSIKEFGSARLADDKIIKFYDIELENGKHVTKNRVGLRNLIHSEVIPGDVDALLVVFHAPGDKDWRLTFISKSVFWDDDFNENKLETSPRRYTYVLGENESVKTAIQQFEKLEDKQITIKHLIELFNVEKLNKKFFEGYKKQYKKFWSYLLKTEEYKRLFSVQNSEKQERTIRNFTKKLLGRIVFLHFLQKKGWMGCTPHPKKWENGERQFLLKLLDGYEDKANFHSKCLTQLFFDTLNQPNRTNDTFEVKGLSNELNGTKVPYLNGGLFEMNTEVNVKNIDFPVSYFEELFDFFGQYNFTIDENSPDDHEVGIDPEMLGHIFENLLEDNKDKGAFYTPKEIVQYMTQESLIQYLQTHLGEHHEIEQFIRHHDKGDEQAKHNFIRNNAEQIETLLDQVKICDPAIGSGAFPMGMLHEIFKAKMALDWTLNRSEVKKNIIQNSIYGVDLESGAVDIARLRFWLALVVDEDEPHALPNLDYKIMQGNSLLESFEGIDLSEIHEGVAIEVDAEKSSVNLFSQELRKKKDVDNKEKLEDLIHSYFDLDDPEAKKALHTKIDQQVLNNIYFTLHDHKADLEKDYKKLQRKIKNKSASLRNAEQKIKYETESKDAKLIKKLNTQLDAIADKQLKLKELYHSNERPFFLWHLLFKEVFDRGGFDIVIGNPPYVQIQKMNKRDKDALQDQAFETFIRTGDIYCLFYEMGFDLLTDNGVLVYVTSNKWMRAGYGKLLREYFLSKDTNTIIQLGPRIFANATVDTNIYVGKKSLYLNKTVGIKTNDKRELVKLTSSSLIPMENLTEEAWVVLDKTGLKIKKAFEKQGKALRNWNLEIYRGVLTGYNEAFIINKEKRDELVKQEPKCDEIIKPILKGREIQKYKANGENDFIINTHNGYLNSQGERLMPIDVINDYTSIWKYLQEMENNLIEEKRTNQKVKLISKRADQGKHWSNLRNCAYLEEFSKEKVIWKRIGSIMRFAYSDEEMYCLDSTCIATGEKIKYLTAVLNSKAGLYQLFKTSPQTGTGDQIISVQALEPMLVPYPTDSVENVFNQIVDQILWIKNKSTKVIESINNDVISLAFEEIIDALVLELYFPEDFKKAGIEILKFANQEFKPIEGLSFMEQKEIILNTYFHFTEKKNPLRNQIKLMKIELKQLLLPILSV